MTYSALIILRISIFIGILAGPLASSIEKNQNKAKAQHPPVVVLELFTSQGCSSCPPADRLLDQVGRQSDWNVITLSYHVAYWNYIGWDDPFSKESHADKQREYAKKFGEGRIYTPQLVVNGKEHFVGSSYKKMKDAVEHYGEINTLNTFDLSQGKSTSKEIHFNYELLGPKHGRKARAVLVLEERKTYVERGENKRRTLKNTNIVIAERSIDVEGTSSKIKIPTFVEEGDELRLILIAENGRNDIVGARQMRL